MKSPISDSFDEPRERDFDGNFRTKARYRQSRAVRAALGTFIVGCLGSAIAVTVLRVFLPSPADYADLHRPPSQAMAAPQEHFTTPPPPPPARHQTQPKNQLTYRADRSGHYVLDAAVNGASM